MPTSPNKILANQRNAARSTGPRTPAGRQRAALNALKTGLFARTTLLPAENPQALTDLRDAFVTRLAPADPLEFLLVERAIAHAWRLSRLQRLESQLIARLRPAPQSLIKDPSPQAEDAAWLLSLLDSGRMETHNRLELRAERALSRALAELARLQRTRPTPDADSAAADPASLDPEQDAPEPDPLIEHLPPAPPPPATQIGSNEPTDPPILSSNPLPAISNGQIGSNEPTAEDDPAALADAQYAYNGLARLFRARFGHEPPDPFTPDSYR